MGTSAEGTGRQRVEAGLSDSEEGFQAIFSQPAVGIAETGVDGKWRLVNDRYCEILGYTQDELRNKSLLDITHPEDREAVLDTRRRLLAGEISSHSMKKQYLRKDGTVVWGRWFISLVRDHDNLPRYFISVVEDITEKIQAERARVDSEQRLMLVHNAAQLGLWDCDLRTNTTVFSKEYSSLHGLAPDHPPLTHEQWVELVHPADRERVQAFLRESVDHTHFWDTEFRVVWPDGTVHWLLGKGKVFLDDTGVPVRMAGVTLDITDRKQAEAALRESEERYKEVFDITSECIFVVEVAPDGRFKFVGLNPAGEKAVGLTNAEVSGRFVEDVVAEDLAKAVTTRYRHCLETGTFINYDEELDLPTGRRYFQTNLIPVRNAAGRIHRIVGIARDITERKRGEAELRESEERFRNMADTAPVGIWATCPSGLISFYNKHALMFVGRTMDELTGSSGTELIHPDDREGVQSAFESALASRSPCKFDCRIRRADGEYRWVLCNGVPRFDTGGAFSGYVGSFIDTTDIRRAQEEILGHQKLESLGRMARGIAHDFNNLLGGILTSAELALEERADGSPFEEDLNRIRLASIRGAEIVRQLMIFGGEENAAFETVNVSLLIREMLELLKVSISKHAILDAELAEDLPAVQANPAQLRQVVMNLISNASEAIGDQNGVIRVTTRPVKVDRNSPMAALEGLAEGDYMQLEVSDTGRGMTMDMQARAFDPFFTTKSPGHGLGLAVVQGIVRSVGGTIRLVSAPGEGTTFQILLPCAQHTAQATASTMSRAEEEKGTPRVVTILVVEDEDLLRQPVSTMLRKTGFTVIEANNGSAALDLIRTHKDEMDVLLLDITLPGASSREVFEETKRLLPDLAVIITSANSQEMAAASLCAGRIERFIRKPYQFGDLVDMIREIQSS